MVPASFADRRICILGLGYVGLTLAVAMARKGFQVHGVERRQEVLDLLASGAPHFHEPGLAERLKQVVENGALTFSAQIPEKSNATVYIITVGTPLDAQGHARLDMVTNVARDVARVMPEGSLVLLRSTVKIGTARNVVVPVLKESGKSFEIAGCPERTLEGRAVLELDYLPQIIGADDLNTLHRAAQLFSFLTPTTVRVSSLETAELIKLVDNTSRDVGFAFSNEIALACDALGLSAAEVIRAGKLGYPRTNLPMPGPVGGPCLEKDPHILCESLAEKGLSLPITTAARQINEGQPRQIASFVAGALKTRLSASSKPVIALLGLAFKGQPETDDLRGTMARPIFDALKVEFPNAEWRGYDRIVKADDIQSFGLNPAAALEDALNGAHAALILNNHPAFQNMPIEKLAGVMAEPGLIYDCWNLFSETELKLPPNRAYFALGSQQRGKFTKWD